MCSYGAALSVTVRALQIPCTLCYREKTTSFIYFSELKATILMYYGNEQVKIVILRNMGIIWAVPFPL